MNNCLIHFADFHLGFLVLSEYPSISIWGDHYSPEILNMSPRQVSNFVQSSGLDRECAANLNQGVCGIVNHVKRVRSGSYRVATNTPRKCSADPVATTG
jgi:hypothetical protein